MLIVLGFLVTSAPAKAADAPAAPEDIIRIPIECEDMEGVRWGPEGFTPTWTAGRWGRDLHQNMIFGGVWASRMAAAVCDASDQASEVYRDVEVPRAGRYKVWAKYECPPFFSYPFAIRIQPLDQAGRPQKAVFDKVYGLRDAAKHFSFLNELRKGDLYWNWGMDHDAAEGYEVDLPKGRMRVTLAKAAAPKGEPVGARSVDALLITSRLSELSAPDYPRFPLLDDLQQANHVYVRFRNTGTEPIVVTWNHWNHRAPQYYTFDRRHAALVRFYDAAGKLIADGGKPRLPVNGQWPDPIPPGSMSPWIDVGPTVTTENSCPFYAFATQPGKPRDAAPELPFTLEVATEPRDAAVVTSVAKRAKEPQVALLIQPDLHRADGKAWTLPITEVYRRMTAELEREPRIGPTPRKLRLYGHVGFAFAAAPLMADRADLPVSFDYAIALGLNTLPVRPTDAELPAADAATAHYAAKKAPLIEPSGAYHHTQDLAVLAKQFTNPKAKARLYYNSFGDEIGLPRLDLKDPKLLGAFRAFLQQRGVKPADLGLKSLDEARPLTTYSAAVAVQIGVLPAPKQGKPELPPGEAGKFLKRLYWLSGQFMTEQGVKHFAEKTAEMTQLIGPHFKTSANLGGMHPFYWMHQASFIESFRGGAMSLAWTEDYDYCQPEGSRLVAEFLAAYLRAGAKYRDTPMMFYCMPHYPGNSGRHLVQNAVLEWGQGVRDLDFFNVSPDAFSTENYIHSRGGVAETGRAIRRISGMAGNVEDDLLAAKPRTGRVALLLSEASDVWEVEGQGQGAVVPGSTATNVSQEERKALWYCLRNHGYLVDLLTENDVAEGRLKGYRALYVCGRNLDRRAAGPIRAWVEAGGQLYLTAGAARRDESDEPFTGLDELVGRGTLDTKAEWYRGSLRARLELLQIPALGRVTVARGDKRWAFDALASRETLQPAHGAEVIGQYAGGTPAVTRRAIGTGAAYVVGTLPGQAYVRRSLLPARPMGKGGPDGNFSQWEPVDYDPDAAAVILLPLTESGLLPDAVVNRRGVVVHVAEAPTATVITVVNLARRADGKAKDVEITVSGLRPARSVRTAARQGAQVQPGKPVVRLAELDDADVIVVQH